MKPLTEAEGLSRMPRWCAVAVAPVALGYVAAALPMLLHGAGLVMLAACTILALPLLMPFYLAALAHHICRAAGMTGWQARLHLVLLLGALAAVAWLPLFLLLIVFATTF